jgi:hypothetical protein
VVAPLALKVAVSPIQIVPVEEITLSVGFGNTKISVVAEDEQLMLLPFMVYT